VNVNGWRGALLVVAERHIVRVRPEIEMVDHVKSGWIKIRINPVFHALSNFHIRGNFI